MSEEQKAESNEKNLFQFRFDVPATSARSIVFSMGIKGGSIAEGYSRNKFFANVEFLCDL